MRVKRAVSRPSLRPHHKFRAFALINLSWPPASSLPPIQAQFYLLLHEGLPSRKDTPRIILTMDKWNHISEVLPSHNAFPAPNTLSV